MLYICATPIGNLADISQRALEVLNSAEIILCEDSRVSQKLLQHYAINGKKLVAFHEHNENEISQKVIAWLNENKTIVQISDAGTPGISDPGARLCNLLLNHGYPISPIPGACAYIALLSVAGLVNIPHLFYGFLSAKTHARKTSLAQWVKVNYAIVVYESPHRINASLADIQEVLGADRMIVMGRELTKRFETIKKLPVNQLINFILNDPNQQRGEFSLIILPDTQEPLDDEQLTEQQLSALKLLAKELPPKKAVNLVNQLFGGNKDLLYTETLKLTK